MIKFENTEVIGWESAIRGMRNPMNSWEKSDSGWFSSEDDMGVDYVQYNSHSDPSELYFVGQNDLDLMARLRNAGTDHRKFMRMITVYVDITAPLYWWKEFDTYKIGTVANSCSTMHKIAAKEFTLEDFSHEHLFTEENLRYDAEPDSLKLLNTIIEALNVYRLAYLEEGDKSIWWQMIQLLPSSYNQRRTVMLNYEVLANIYKSRKNHKLDEWSVGFMEWIESLPYSELITGEEKKIMTNKKRKQTGLLHSTDELKQLIAENPEMNGWINANYEQPNTARDVLVFEKGIGVSIGFFIDGWHMYGSNDFEIEVTYWRELSDPLGRVQYGKI